jgi:predicted Zn-dependent peptidase
MSREAIMGYMDKAYGAGSMVLSAAGMIEHDQLVALASHLFRDLPDRQPISNETASYGGGSHLIDRDLEQVHLTVGFPGLGMHDPDIYAATVMSVLFGGGMSSRLFQEIRERRGLVYSIHSYCSCYSDCGLFGIYAGTGEEEIAELLPVLADEVQRLAASLEEGEVRRARNQLKAATLMSLESTGSRAEQLGEQMLVFGRPLPIEEIVSRIDAIDVDAVRRVAERIFAGRPSLAAIGPLGRMMPYDRFAERLSA